VTLLAAKDPMTYGTLRSVDDSILEPFPDVVDPSDQGEFERLVASKHLSPEDQDEFSADDGSGFRFVG
jgi:hypothetical protein